MFTSQLSVPECIMARLETELRNVSSPYSVVYDSDDEETCILRLHRPKPGYLICSVMEMRPCNAADLSGGTTVDFSGVNGWISEQIRIEEVRRMEDGVLGCDTLFISNYWLIKNFVQ